MQIEIDFEVFKALTNRRDDENVSYNDVLRNLLGLAGATMQTRVGSMDANAAKTFSSSTEVDGYAYRGGFLPNGTKLKALYKNRVYTAEITEGKWLNEDGSNHATPTSAASHITKTSTNARHFWSAKRPNDVDWTRLNSLQDAVR